MTKVERLRNHERNKLLAIIIAGMFQDPRYGGMHADQIVKRANRIVEEIEGLGATDNTTTQPKGVTEENGKFPHSCCNKQAVQPPFSDKPEADGRLSAA